MRCQEADRGEVLLNEVRAKGFGSSPPCGDAGRTQKAVWRGKAPCCCGSGERRGTGEYMTEVRTSSRFERPCAVIEETRETSADAEGVHAPDAAKASTQESGLRENRTSRLSERAEAGCKPHLSRLYSCEADEQSGAADCVYGGANHSGAGGAK